MSLKYKIASYTWNSMPYKCLFKALFKTYRKFYVILRKVTNTTKWFNEGRLKLDNSIDVFLVKN